MLKETKHSEVRCGKVQNLAPFANICSIFVIKGLLFPTGGFREMKEKLACQFILARALSASKHFNCIDNCVKFELDPLGAVGCSPSKLYPNSKPRGNCVGKMVLIKATGDISWLDFLSSV